MMKDILIPAPAIKKELTYFVVCFFIALLSNIVAVIIYKSPFTEIFTSLHYVLVFSIFLYLFIGIIRIFIKLIRKSFRKK